MPSDIFDWLPGTLNTTTAEGFSRSLNQFDYDASGRSTWNALQAKISEFLETNILSGKEFWKAQILSNEKIDISQGDLAWYNLADSTTERVGYRIRIPGLHQMIPFPYDDKYVDDSLVYEIMHPVAIFAMGSLEKWTGIGGFKKGDLVWVSFEAGFENRRFLYPVIEGLCDDMDGTGQVTGGSATGIGTIGAFNSGVPLDPYIGPLVETSSSGLKYFAPSGTGASPPGFWEDFSARLQDHVNSLYSGLGLRVANLGVSRDLEAAANAGNPDRASGSKHGAGLAKDHYLHTDKYGEYTNYATDNEVLAKDQDLVDAITSFMNQSQQISDGIIWGGTFGGDCLATGTGDTCRGITEFHHFEFSSSRMPELFEPYREQLAEIGQTPNQLTSLGALQTLYLLLLGVPTE